MSFTREVPSNARQLGEYLQLIHDNQSHVDGVSVNLTNCHLEVKLDWMAHASGKPDVYLPLRRASIESAKVLVEHMITSFHSGYAVSDTDTQQLFDMIDPTGR